jgi:hypothetical protein
MLPALMETVPTGRPLELSEDATPRGEADGKDSTMWVFDGEEWTQDNGGVEPVARTADNKRPRYDELMPELQVIELEIVPVPTRDRQIPPLPIP